MKKIESIKNLLTQLGDVRDGLLVIGAILYGFGYSSWAIHAWFRDIGPVAALDAQYFVAGIPVLIVLTIGWWLGSLLARFYRWWLPWLSKRSISTQQVIYFSSLMGWICVFLYMYLGHPCIQTTEWHYLILGLLAFATFPLLSKLPFKNVAQTLNQIEAFAIINQIYVAIFFLLLALAYLSFVYPHIPQVLGGAKPRKAVIYLYCEKTAPDTYLQLGAMPDSCNAAKVKQTGIVLVYHESKDNILVATEERCAYKPWTLFELNRETIASIKWTE